MIPTRRQIKQANEFMAVLGQKKTLDECKALGKKPKKKTFHEAKEQEVVFEWARLQKCKYPELDLLYAIPNAGKRSRFEGNNMVKQGLRAGVPDICLPVAKHHWSGLYIELKVGRNKTSELQDEWIEKLRKYGHKVEVCYGAESAINAIKQYLGIGGAL